MESHCDCRNDITKEMLRCSNERLGHCSGHRHPDCWGHTFARDRTGRPRGKSNADSEHTLALDFLPQRRTLHPDALPFHGATGSKENCFRFRRGLPSPVLIAIRWIRRDMENRRNLAPSGMSMESGAGPSTSCSGPGSLSGHLDRWTSSSVIRWVLALASGASVKMDFGQSSSLGSAWPLSASTDRRWSCWQVYF